MFEAKNSFFPISITFSEDLSEINVLLRDAKSHIELDVAYKKNEHGVYVAKDSEVEKLAELNAFCEKRKQFLETKKAAVKLQLETLSKEKELEELDKELKISFFNILTKYPPVEKKLKTIL